MACTDCGGSPVRAALVRLTFKVAERLGYRDVSQLPPLGDLVDAAQLEIEAAPAAPSRADR